MPEHEQTLAKLEDKLGILERWLKYQDVIDEVFAEREAQVEQWGDALPPVAGVEFLRPLNRDELVQAIAAGVKLVQDMDKAAAGV